MVALSLAAALTTLAPLDFGIQEEDTHARVAEPTPAEATGDADLPVDALLVPLAHAAEPELLDRDDHREASADDLDDAADELAPVTPVAPVWHGTARITFYAPGCGDSGRTATGTKPTHGTIATDPRLIPLGSKVTLEGFGEGYMALDTGGGVRGAHIDMWVASCPQARSLGNQRRAYRVERWGW